MVTPAIPAACIIISEIAVEWTRSETSMVKTMAAVRTASEMTTTKMTATATEVTAASVASPSPATTHINESGVAI